MKANDLTELELVRAEQICRLNHQLLCLMAVYAKDARDIDHVVGRLHIGHEQITHIALSRQVDRNTAKADHFSLGTIVHHPSTPHHQPIALRPPPSHPRRRRTHAPPNPRHPRPTTRTAPLTGLCVKGFTADTVIAGGGSPESSKLTSGFALHCNSAKPCGLRRRRALLYAIV